MENEITHNNGVPQFLITINKRLLDLSKRSKTF